MKQDEYFEQCKVVIHLTILKIKGLVKEFFSVENENKMSFLNVGLASKQGKQSEKSGKKSGASDLVIVLQDKVLFIEMKRKRKILKSGSFSKEDLASDEQKKFIENIMKSDVCYGFICYGYNEAREVIDRFVN